MATNRLHGSFRALAAATLLGALLAGCGRTPQPEPVPPPPPSPAETPPQPAEPAAGMPDAQPPPESSPAAPAQPAPAAPPPTDPSPAPKPTSTEPTLEGMHPALASAKMTVAADLRYQFDGAALLNQPVTLHLAAVPHVAGTELKVTVKSVEGIDLAAGAQTLQKSGATSVFRRQYSVTRRADSPASIRVLVTMDVPGASAFGFFTVPLEAGTSAQNQQESLKQR